MSEYAVIRDAITTVLAGVSGIGQVHSRMRWTVKVETMKSLYSKNGKINGWVARRIRTAVDRSPGEEIRTHTFRISGFYALADDDQAATASEQQFQELIERICDAFRPETSISAMAALAGPVTVSTIEERDFAGITVHYCELLLPVDEQALIEP